MKILYTAAVFRGRNDDSLHYDDEKALQAVMDKLEENLPSITLVRVPDNEQEPDMGV